MTKGDAGQNISKFASSSTEASSISTSMPYISYVDLASWLQTMYNHAVDAFYAYVGTTSIEYLSAQGFKDFCAKSSNFTDVFICDGYRLCRAAKLLMALGYGNFSTAVQYDLLSSALTYARMSAYGWKLDGFKASPYYLDFAKYESSTILNSPNLSILPLLAYHKICNDAIS